MPPKTNERYTKQDMDNTEKRNLLETTITIPSRDFNEILRNIWEQKGSNAINE